MNTSSTKLISDFYWHHHRWKISTYALMWDIKYQTYEITANNDIRAITLQFSGFMWIFQTLNADVVLIHFSDTWNVASSLTSEGSLHLHWIKLTCPLQIVFSAFVIWLKCLQKLHFIGMQFLCRTVDCGKCSTYNINGFSRTTIKC